MRITAPPMSSGSTSVSSSTARPVRSASSVAKRSRRSSSISTAVRTTARATPRRSSSSSR